MRLSIFFEIQHWKPWAEGAEYRAYWNVLERYRAAGTDQALLWFRFGGVPQEQAMRSLKLVGERVLPRFH